MNAKTLEPTPVESIDPENASEVRYAVRFPVELPVRVVTRAGEFEALTENVSASGVLFLGKEPIEVDSTVKFFLKMPAGSIGAAEDVVVECVGTVTRCSNDSGGAHIAALIEDYRINPNRKC